MSTDAPEILLLLTSFAGFMIVLEVGFRFGRKTRDSAKDLERVHLNTLQSALFGLLSLLLGFNFAAAASRYETRKVLIQEEVDTIATAALRARLLPIADRKEILPLLSDYVSSRITAETGSTESSIIRKRLWAKTEEISARPVPPSTFNLFVPALDQMSNSAWKRRSAIENHVPTLTIALMLTISISALLFLSYCYGLGGIRRHYSSGILALMISLVLTTIIDLDQPNSGFVRVDKSSMTRLKASLNEMLE